MTEPRDIPLGDLVTDRCREAPGVIQDPPVSSDVLPDPRASIVDLEMTHAPEVALG